LRDSGSKSPAEITRTVREEVRAFTGADSVKDDLTCIAVSIRGGETRSEEAALYSRELDLTSSLTQLGKVRRFVREACEHRAAAALNDETVWQLELAVNEAAANVIKHAYGGRQDEWFGAAAEIRENEIAFTVKHRGKALDDRPLEDPAFDGSRDNGFGLFIIENYMDRIERFEDAAGNKCTRMVKKLANT
jgi:serine/threonine-protein kinase RsbW